jgi:hypothetical protein
MASRSVGKALRAFSDHRDDCDPDLRVDGVGARGRDHALEQEQLSLTASHGGSV